MDSTPSEAKLHDLRLRATQTLQLIGLVEVNRVLYDTSDKNYTRKKAKSAAWRQISAAVLGVKPEGVSRLQSLQIQHKWKSLRTAYVRQRRKANPLTPYRYADLMSFLDPFLRRDDDAKAPPLEAGRYSAPFELDLNGDVTGDMRSADSCIDLFDPIEEDLTCDAQIEHSRLVESTPSVLSSVDSAMIEANGNQAVAAMAQRLGDELEGFFLQVSRTVRKFSPRKVIELKMQIFNLVSQAELDELDALNQY